MLAKEREAQAVETSHPKDLEYIRYIPIYLFSVRPVIRENNQHAVIDCNNLVYRIADTHNKQKGVKLSALKFV